MLKLISQVKKKFFDDAGINFPEDWNVEFISLSTPQDELSDACRGCDCLFTNSDTVISAALIDANPQLKLIQTHGSSYNLIDLDAADRNGVYVCSNRGANAGATAEHAVGLMLAGLRRTVECNECIDEAGYKNAMKIMRGKGIHELSACRVGILGFGTIGREVAKRLAAWGCRVSYNSRRRAESKIESELNVDYVSFDELISECDVISIHVPVLPETTGMINKDVLSRMKPNAILVNTARGQIINQDDLAEALEKGTIAAALLDVLHPEPAPQNLPLLNLTKEARKRLVLTPHVAGVTEEIMLKLTRMSFENFKRIASGQIPLNIVNHPTK